VRCACVCVCACMCVVCVVCVYVVWTDMTVTAHHLCSGKLKSKLGTDLVAVAIL